MGPSPGQESAHATLATYTTMVRAVGGIPILLVPGSDDEAERVLGLIDGLLLSGGGDVDPERYGGARPDSVYAVDEVRDEYEITLSRLAAERHLPTLCICRGLQVMNVAMGGTLIEDIADESPAHLIHRMDGDEAHQARHAVTIEPGSSTAKALGRDHLEVNSLHHQAVRAVGSGLVATGFAPDGIVESLAPEDPEWPMWAVQWHPEYLGPSDEPSLALFEAFIRAAGG